MRISLDFVKALEKHFETIFGTGVCPRIWHRDITEDLYFNQMEDIYEVPDVMAAHWLISKDCINKVGGFSPAFPHYGEDDNFVNRCRYHGFKVGIVPSARAVHDADSHPADRKKKIYLTNIFMLVNLQKIFDAYRHPYFMMLHYAIRMSIKLMSMYPLWFYVKHVVNRRTYAQYRNMSKTTAFLS